MFVTKCICFRATFAILKKMCQHHGWRSLKDVVQNTRAGTGCGACKPYVQQMLVTGATTFQIAEPGKPPVPAVVPGEQDSGDQGIQQKCARPEGVSRRVEIPREP